MRHIWPLLIPVSALAVAGVIIFIMSRILLSFNHETTPMVALAIALVFLLGASALSTRLPDPTGH